jgi:hypothetical protein
MKHEMTRQVDADGILRFTMELGEEYANKFVCLTVASIEPQPDVSPTRESADAEAQKREERRRFIEEMAGIITDPTFVRHPQGEFEKRDEL